MIKQPHKISNEWFYVTDWLPTILTAAGINVNLTDSIDGLDQWNMISTGSDGLRKELPVNIDEKFGYGILISNGYKLVNGTTVNGRYDRWMGILDQSEEEDPDSYYHIVHNSPTFKAIAKFTIGNDSRNRIDHLRHRLKLKCNNVVNQNSCNPLSSPCLFNLLQDPCELNNIAEQEPLWLSKMLNRLQELSGQKVPARNLPGDPESDPTKFNNSWTWWNEATDNDLRDLKSSEIKVRKLFQH